MSMTIPTMPKLTAGYVVQLSDMQALANAATFLLTKPMTRIRDGTGGVAIGTSPTLVTYTTADFDTDGMWSAGTPNRLTVQTPGWYKVRHMTATNTISNPTINSWAISTSGNNNPGGSGVVTGPFWSGSSDGVAGLQGAHSTGSGIWPVYLYAGDFVQVQVEAPTTADSTTNSPPAPATNGGSILSLEYVSI